MAGWKYARHVKTWIDPDLEHDISRGPWIQGELEALSESLRWHGEVYLAQHRDKGLSYVHKRRAVKGVDWWVDLESIDGDAAAINEEIQFFNTLIGRGGMGRRAT